MASRPTVPGSQSRARRNAAALSRPVTSRLMGRPGCAQESVGARTALGAHVAPATIGRPCRVARPAPHTRRHRVRANAAREKPCAAPLTRKWRNGSPPAACTRIAVDIYGGSNRAVPCTSRYNRTRRWSGAAACAPASAARAAIANLPSQDSDRSATAFGSSARPAKRASALLGGRAIPVTFQLEAQASCRCRSCCSARTAITQPVARPA